MKKILSVYLIIAISMIISVLFMSPSAVCADSYKIAFSSERDGNPEIYIMNTDGSGQTKITNNPAGDYYPAFSTDGKKIAFSSERDGNPEIYIMNTDGSGQTRLTNNPAEDLSPAFGKSDSSTTTGTATDTQTATTAAPDDNVSVLRRWLRQNNPYSI